MIQPRPYRDEHDLEKILALLVEGRQANNGTYYVHTGDLRTVDILQTYEKSL